MIRGTPTGFRATENFVNRFRGLMLVALCSAELGDHDYAHEALVEMDALGDGMGDLLGTLFRHNPSWEERIRAGLEAIRTEFANGEAGLPE